MKKVIIWAMLLLAVAGGNAMAAEIIKPPAIAISGYTQIGYIRNDSTSNTTFSDNAMDDGFRLIRARLTFKTEIDPRVALNVQIDVAARHATNTQVLNMLTDGYFDLKFVKDHTIRLGQFKVPFGLENPMSDAKTFLVNTSIVKNTSINTRDIGVDISSKRPAVEYHVAILNGAGANKNDNNTKKDILGTVQTTLGKVTVGASAINSPGDSTQTTLRHAVDGYVQAKSDVGELDLEYVKGTDKAAAKRAGWYLLAAPQLNPRTWLVGRYEQYDPNKSLSNNEATRTTLGILYKTSKYSLLKINYEWRSDKAAVKSGDVFSIMWQAEY